MQTHRSFALYYLIGGRHRIKRVFAKGLATAYAITKSIQWCISVPIIVISTSAAIEYPGVGALMPPAKKTITTIPSNIA